MVRRSTRSRRQLRWYNISLSSNGLQQSLGEIPGFRQPLGRLCLTENSSIPICSSSVMRLSTSFCAAGNEGEGKAISFRPESDLTTTLYGGSLSARQIVYPLNINSTSLMNHMVRSFMGLFLTILNWISSLTIQHPRDRTHDIRKHTVKTGGATDKGSESVLSTGHWDRNQDHLQDLLASNP